MCYSYVGAAKKENVALSGIGFEPNILADGQITISASPSKTNALAKVTVYFTVENRIPSMGTLNMQFPAQNSQINSNAGLSLPSAISMLPNDRNLLSVSGSY